MSNKYSRQYYALQDVITLPTRPPNSKILVSNITTLAIEIIKNLLIQEHGEITLHNASAITNPYPTLELVTSPLTQTMMSNYNLIIFVDYDPTVLVPKPHIITKTKGLTGQIIHNYPNTIFKDTNDLGMHAIYKSDPTSPYTQFIEQVKYYYENVDIDIANKFYYSYKCTVHPVNSIIGSIVSQDVLKFIYNVQSEIFQYQYFEAFSCLQTDSNAITIFDKEFQNKIENSTCFIVGMGSIGNLLLKNLTLMGVKNVVIADPKNISEENIGTHSLFTDDNINKSKTAIAKLAMKNNNIFDNNDYIENTPVCNKLYDKKFYESMTCVFGSVDNNISREYIDSRCVLFNTPYIDCGSEGFMGHVQVVVPNLTDSYSSTNDNVSEPSYPLCAISSFPTQIEHCIVWAQEQLDEIFCKNITLFKTYLNDPKMSLDDDKKKTLLEIFNSIPNSSEGCYLVAGKMFKKLYCDSIDELLNKFPEDHMMEDGEMFWKLPKLCPHVIILDDSNKDVVDKFISKCVKMWRRTFIIPDDIEFEQINELPTDLSKYKKIKVEIQKVEAGLIYYGSTLRAMNYGIESVNEFNSIKISEKIIPRLVSTSGIVAGLACLEFYKILLNAGNYKNSFVSKDEIISADVLPYIKNGKFGIWDSFVVQDIKTVKEFIQLFKDKYKINVTAIIYGSFMFYSDMLSKDKLKERLEMNIIDVIENQMKIKIDESITLNIYDDGDDDEDLPGVLFII
jgi:ubiquitin-activating enzyme E1